MRKIVGEWVKKCKKLPKIGEMTHIERCRTTFELKDPDIVPIMPELDQWPIYYAGYNFKDTWEDLDAWADGLLKCYHDFRSDCIWPYACPSFAVDPFLTPEERKKWYNIRDKRSYVLYNEITDNLDKIIERLEKKPWEKYGYGRQELYGKNLEDMLDFKEAMDGEIAIIPGLWNTSNLCEWMVGVQHFIEWTVTEPKEKVHYYMQLMHDFVDSALEGFAEVCAKRGVEFFCIFGGSRTWGPKQFEEFGMYDNLIANKAAKLFKYVFHHVCGNNLPYAMQHLASFPYDGFQYDEKMQQFDWSWAKWTEWVARLCEGKAVPMNAPTTQVCAWGTPQEIDTMVKEYIEHTTPFVPAGIMPGCELSIHTSAENVRAMIEGGRKWGKYPECKTRAKLIWTDEEFKASLPKLVAPEGKMPVWAWYWQKIPDRLRIKHEDIYSKT